MKKTRDVSGDKAAYGEWKELADDADEVFYLLRADRLFTGDTSVEARVRKDLQHVGQWLEARKPRPRLFIVGTHCDFDPEYPGHSNNKLGDYYDKFCGLPIVMDLVVQSGGAKHTKIALGDMKTPKATEALLYQIFRQVIR